MYFLIPLEVRYVCILYQLLVGNALVSVISRICSVILLNKDLVWKKEEKKSVFMNRRYYELKNYYCNVFVHLINNTLKDHLNI